MKKFLIVINTHNSYFFLKDTIYSLINQEYPKDQYLIVILDTSDVKDRPFEHPNIVWIELDKRLEIAENWNRGLDIALKKASDLNFNFDFYGIFHDDDIYDSKILVTYNYAILNHDTDIIVCSWQIMSNSLLYKFYYNYLYNEKLKDNKLFHKGSSYANEVARRWYRQPTPAIMFKKSIYDMGFKYDPYYGFDLDVAYMLELTKHFDFLVVRQQLLKYRLHDQSTTNKSISFKKLRDEKKLYLMLRECISSTYAAQLYDMIFIRRIMFAVTVCSKRKMLMRILKIILRHLHTTEHTSELLVQIIKISIKFIKVSK